MNLRRAARTCAVGLWLCLLVHPASSRAEGEPAPDFGDGQQLLLARPVPFAAGRAQLGDVATLADGRIVWTMEDGIGGLWLARLLRKGEFDHTFAGSGLLRLDTCVAPAPAQLVALEDGGVLLWSGNCLLRLLADGSLDPSFQFAGNGPTADFSAVELLRDAQGRWLLAGNEKQQWRVYRFLADGRSDTGFADAGVATIPTPSSNGTRTLYAIALRADGRIVVAGTRGNSNGPSLVLAGLEADGAIDLDFGDDGIVDQAAPKGYNSLSAKALLIDRDGSLVVGGEAYTGHLGCCVLFERFSASGTLMPDTPQLFPLGDNVSLLPFGESSVSLARLPHGKILMARISNPVSATTRTRFTLIRLHADGRLDDRFNTVGWRSYVVGDPTGQGQLGAYSQIHGMTYANGEALLFGRTFFEDHSVGVDYVTLLRTRFDALFEDSFDSGAVEDGTP